MLHRQLRNALEEIFGASFIEEALADTPVAQMILYERPDDFKEAVLGFQLQQENEEGKAAAAKAA